MLKRTVLAACAASALLSALPVSAQTYSTAGASIVTVEASLGNTVDMTQLLAASGLDAELLASGPYTLFVPTDAAFDALPGDAVTDLTDPANHAMLVKLLSEHIVPGEWTYADVSLALSGDAAVADKDDRGVNLTTISGEPLFIGLSGGNLYVRDSQSHIVEVVQKNVEGSNGVVHVVNKVLMPST